MSTDDVLAAARSFVQRKGIAALALVDIVTDRALAHVTGSPLAPHLHPDPEAAVEFILGVVFAELLSPARHLTHEQIADYAAAAVHGR